MKYLSLLFVLTLFSSWSQDLKRDFVQMNEYLSSLNNYQMSVQYSAAEGTDLEEKGEVSVYVSGEGLFYDLGIGNKMIINSENIIIIDDIEKSIVFSENKKVKQGKSVNLVDNLISGIDTLIAKTDTILYTVSGNLRTYSLRFENGYFDMVQIHFEDKILRKVDYFYNSDHVEIDGIKNTCLVNYVENTPIEAKYLSSEYYLVNNAGNTTPSENFNNYLIIYNGSLENYID